MGFHDDPKTIRWRLHLHLDIANVYQVLSTDVERASFWTESAIEQNGVIHFPKQHHLEWASDSRNPVSQS
jgi:hypothetical protein